MRFQVVAAAVDAEAVVAGEVDAAVAALRRDKCSPQDDEHLGKA
jgi:hypothetical protein